MRALTRARRRIGATLTAAQCRSVAAMAAVVGGLHAVGFFLLIVLVAPHHYRMGTSGAFTIGVGVTAYTLGLRHAFDADHIAAIDNTTRKLAGEGQRPLSVGFFFSLGHSSVVFVLAILLNFGIRGLDNQVSSDSSGLLAWIRVAWLPRALRYFCTMTRGTWIPTCWPSSPASRTVTVTTVEPN